MKYCPRCGRNLKETEKFCPNCGSLAHEDRKAKRALFICIALCSLMISLFTNLSDRESSEQVTDTQEVVTVKANEEYTKIFSDRHIEDTSDLERLSGRRYGEYVCVDEEDNIYKVEFSHVGDTILYLVDTSYFPIRGLDRDELKEFDDEIKNETKELEELGFVEVTREVRNRHYMLKISYKYLDNPENLAALSEINSKQWGEGVDILSARLTKEGLKEDGWVKK